MKVIRYERLRNKLGGVHVQEITEEVPDPIDYTKETHDKLVSLRESLRKRLVDLKERQKKIAEKLGIKEVSK